MSWVATAVVGSSVVSAYMSGKSSDKSAKATGKAADAAAEATIKTTKMQIDELARQFDYQQQVLQPQIQQQFNAQRAYSDILGIGGNELSTVPPGTGGIKPVKNQISARDQDEIDTLQSRIDAGGLPPQVRYRMANRIASIKANSGKFIKAGKSLSDTRFAGAGPQATMPGPGEGYNRSGPFVDPNLDPTRLAEVETLSGTVQDNLLAGTDAENDPYRNYIAGTGLDNSDLLDYVGGSAVTGDAVSRGIADTSLIGPGGFEGDNVRRDISSRMLADGAAGTGVYGDMFKESPGYAFQVEEMNRALDRKGSAGGPNIGGRAIMEAQRRAQGLAAGEYYNWAAGRERDLSRLGDAERTDIGRMDNTAYNFQDLQMNEQGRGDQALYNAQNLKLNEQGRGDRAAYTGLDLQMNEQGRGDRAYQDYLNRRKGDVSRIDAAASNKDQLVAIDQQRRDQGYYNYLDAVARQAGFGGGAAAQAVNSSQRQGGAVANAYGSQGSQLSNIFQNQGVNEANIAMNKYGGYNNAIQGGIENYIAIKGLAA